MSIMRQQSLFDIHELYEMEPPHRFNAIFSTINLDPIWVLFRKQTNVGPPRELNYGATHFEARDRATGSKNKEKPAPKKRGRKPKAEREQWLKEKEAAEEALPIYEKKIEHQLTESVETLFREAPSYQCGV